MQSALRSTPSRQCFRPSTRPGPPVHLTRQAKCHALPELFSLADVAPQVAATGSQVANQVSQAAPGSVQSPGWILPVGALIITVVGGGFAILLNPGNEAAEKIFERDARKKAIKQSTKGKSPLSGRAGQMVTKRGRK